jgi:glyoxylase-like metal-dependent hydrolase (beta-lactamase superfamily II)
MELRPFFDPATQTLTYLVWDPATKDAVVIDPVLDFDGAAARTSTGSVEKVAAAVRELGVTLHWVLETHPHADHLSASQWLRRHLGAKLAIGERIREVQACFQPLFGLGPEFRVDGSQFDRLLADGEVLHAGSIAIEVIATPGHTPACVTYKIEDTIFTGDALFIHDYGTGRCDFPCGSAAKLYDSIQRLYALPPETRVCPAHDYQPGGRELIWHTTIGASRAKNIQLQAETTRDAFIEFRTDRDKTLSTPKLYYPSVLVNLDGGRLPRANAAGKRYLTIPLDLGLPVDDDGTPR